MIKLKLNRAAKAANCNVPLFVSRYTGEQGTGYFRAWEDTRACKDETEGETRAWRRHTRIVSILG